MGRITYDGQSFILDNRRIWLVGAGIDYARVPAGLWRERIAAIRQAGFNTVLVQCPWLVHEPRKGRFEFNDQADVRAFLEICVEHGLYVVLKIGPYIGAGYDGGGLPSWLSELPDIAMRESNPVYLERVGMYCRKLLSQLVDLQADKLRSGGIILIQAEHSWLCTRDDVADAYLGDLSKHIRENGFNVPVINANAFWSEARGAIESWIGFDNLLVNLRQMRAFQPIAPRVVSNFRVAAPAVWGDPVDESRTADLTLYNFCQILAAGAQPLVGDFHGGTNFGYLSGRVAGRPDGFITTTPSLNSPLGEAGARGRKYQLLKRVATFATHFGAVFADLDPDYQPVTVSIDHVSTEGERGATVGSKGVAVVPLRGARGRAVFVFGDPTAENQTTSLLLDHGIPLSLDLGDQAVGWYLIDVDLGGVAWLDFANVCPFALVARSIFVVFGPAGMQAQLSINESLVEVTIPTGAKPRVVAHQDITVVVCNETQIDATLVDANRVYVGVSGFDESGEPIGHPDFEQTTVIDKEQGATNQSFDAPPTRASATRLESWKGASAQSQTDGTNPRYASLAGPATLDACGTPSGYGWYQVAIKSAGAKKRACAIAGVGQRMQLFVDGEPIGVLGTGPGASGYFFDLKLAKGEHTLVGLVDHTGRFAEGNDFGRRKGWFGHLYEVKPLKVKKPHVERRDPVDPFLAGNFILGQSQGRMMSEQQVVWSFTHRKKSEILLHIDQCPVPGIFLLNDEPLMFYAGETGEQSMRFMIDPFGLEIFKRGANELRFAPDPEYDDGAQTMAEALTIYECVENLTESSSWGFARWEHPSADSFEEFSKNKMRDHKGVPAWWRTTFKPRKTPLAKWFDTCGLSKGQAFLNGRNLGRYFTATADGKKVGPQSRLYLPEPWLNTGEQNELIIFDEHGFHPSKTRILYCNEGEFETS